jgi:regulator of sirC expression with transglutaminase-like and TPR domain
MHIARPMHCRPRAFDCFAAQLPHIETDDGLIAAAVAVSMHELDDADPIQTHRQLDDFAATVRSRVRTGRPQALLAHLHGLLFDEIGFAGNQQDYYNPRNSYLPCVLSTRRGIPITLTLLYKAVAGRLGLRVHGVNAPGHFLAGVEVEDAEDGWMLVDPYFGGRAMSRAEAFDRIEAIVNRPVPRSVELLPVAGHRAWLLRMLNNLQNVFGYAGRKDDLAAMLELRRLLEMSE